METMTGSTKDISKLKSGLRAGKPLKHAMMEAGYPESTANKGRAGLSKRVYRELLRSKLDIYGDVSAEDRARLFRSAVVENVVTGKDNAVQSLKLMAQDNQLGILTADTLIQAVIIQAPEKTTPQIASVDDPKLLEE